MKYMWIDFYKQYFVAALMDEGGRLMRRDKVSTDRAAIRDYIRSVDGDGGLCCAI